MNLDISTMDDNLRTMITSVPTGDDPAAKVFISYSRKDAAALEVLRPGLEARGYEVLLDSKDIAPAEVWRARLDALILQADAVVFLISPDSIASEVCRWEVDQTLAYGKKLIPILWRPTDPSDCPPAIAERNWIAAPASEAIEAFDHGVMAAVASALETDIDWERERSLWLARATRWQATGEGEGHLLRAVEAAQAEAWAARRPRGAAELTPLLLTYFERSRGQAQIERDRLRSISGRAFVRSVHQAVEDGAPDQALRMAATACVLAEDPDFELVPEIWRAVAPALDSQPIWACGDTGDGATEAVVADVAPDGSLAVVATPSGSILLHDPIAGTDLWRVTAEAPVQRLGLLANGDVWAVLAGGEFQRRDRRSGEVGLRVGLGEDAAEGVFDRLTSGYCHASGAEVRRLDVLTGEVEDVARFERPVTLLAYEASADCGLAVLDSDVEWTDARIFGPGRSASFVVMLPVAHGAISQDGTVAAVSSGGDIHVIDAVSGQEMFVCGHAGGVSCLTLNRDGTRLLSAGGDGVVRLWDQQGKELRHFDLGRSARISRLIFSGDEWTALVMTQTTSMRWSLANGEASLIVADHPSGNPVDPRRTGMADLGFAPDRAIWSLQKSGLVQVWRETKPAIIDLRPHLRDADQTALFIGPGPGADVFILADDRVLRVDGHGTVQATEVEVGASRIVGGALGSDGRTYHVLGEAGLHAIDLETGTTLWTVDVEARPARLAVSEETGTVLIAGDTVEVRTRDGALIGAHPLAGRVSAAIWSRHRQCFLIASMGGDWLALDDTTGGLIKAPPEPGPLTTLFERADGTLWALGDGAVWSTSDGEWSLASALSGIGDGLAVHPSAPLACVFDGSKASFVDLKRDAPLRTVQTFNLFDQRSMGRLITQGWSRLAAMGRRGRLRHWPIDDLVRRVADPAGALSDLLTAGRDIPRASERHDILMRDQPTELVARLGRLRS